jgi:hypothetical protein
VRRATKRVPTRVLVPLAAARRPNDTGALDIIVCAHYDALRYRIFNALHEGNREALTSEVDVLLPSQHVVAVLDEPLAMHGIPRRLRCYSGPEFVAELLPAWCARHVIHSAGHAEQNASIERFNRAVPTRSLERVGVHNA